MFLALHFGTAIEYDVVTMQLVLLFFLRADYKKSIVGHGCIVEELWLQVRCSCLYVMIYFEDFVVTT